MCGSGCCSPGVVGVEREAACPYRSSAQSVAAPEVCARWACDVWRWLRASSGVVGVDRDAACPYRSSAQRVAAPEVCARWACDLAMYCSCFSCILCRRHPLGWCVFWSCSVLYVALASLVLSALGVVLMRCILFVVRYLFFFSVVGVVLSVSFGLAGCLFWCCRIPPHVRMLRYRSEHRCR